MVAESLEEIHAHTQAVASGTVPCDVKTCLRCGKRPEGCVRKKDEDWALFWCSLLEPVIFGEVPEKEIHGFLKGIAQEERLFPNGIRQKPSLTPSGGN